MYLDEYRKLAALEDRMWYFRAVDRRIEFWLERMVQHAPMRVLDAGCGTGGLIARLRARHQDWHFTGVDFMPLACELARERTGVEILQGSITNLPFPDAAFSAIVSIDVVCQVDDDAAALREFARCLRPGGAALVNVPAYRSLWSYHDEACQSKRRYTRPEMSRLFRAAGLELVFASYANLLSLPLVWMRRKVVPPRHPTSDLRVFPAPVEAALRGLAWLEFRWQRARLASPAGSSVFIVGVRR